MYQVPLSILLCYITYKNCIKLSKYPYVEGTLFPHFTAEETLHRTTRVVRNVELSVHVEARI